MRALATLEVVSMAEVQTTSAQERSGCCPYYHDAVELIGRRWSGAIIAVLMASDAPLRFSEIAASVPQLSDRLLSERLKELEARGLLAREATAAAPIRVDYTLTPMGRGLAPALTQLATWAREWLGDGCGPAPGPRPWVGLSPTCGPSPTH